MDLVRVKAYNITPYMKYGDEYDGTQIYHYKKKAYSSLKITLHIPILI